jgi:plastocyanin
VAGAGDGSVDIQRFFPRDVWIHSGDSVTWVWKNPETPHTVTFLAGQQAPDIVLPQPQPNGPPQLQLNPAVLAPSGDPTSYSGGPLNSGFLNPLMPPPGTSGPPTFTVTFDAPGTYTYVCLLHVGMDGSIHVLP